MNQFKNSDEITYALMIKLNMLKRNDLPHLSFKELYSAILYGKWKHDIPVHANEAVRDIMGIPAEEIVTILARMAIVEGGKTSIDDYLELLGGN